MYTADRDGRKETERTHTMYAAADLKPFGIDLKLNFSFSREDELFCFSPQEGSSGGRAV